MSLSTKKPKHIFGDTMHSNSAPNAAATISTARSNSPTILFFLLINSWISVYNLLSCRILIWMKSSFKCDKSLTIIPWERHSSFFPDRNGLFSFLRWRLILWFSEILNETLNWECQSRALIVIAGSTRNLLYNKDTLPLMRLRMFLRNDDKGSKVVNPCHVSLT